jgi:putative FmdB family regulatory protein
MPTYEYLCQACGHQFEVLQKITEDSLTKCPKCQKNKLKRLIGAGLGVIFKGSGFYTTDYKRGSANGPARKGDGKSESQGESRGDGKSESKSESKGDGKSESKSGSKSESSSEHKAKVESKTA